MLNTFCTDHIRAHYTPKQIHSTLLSEPAPPVPAGLSCHLQLHQAPPSCPAHKTRHLPSFSVLSTTFVGVTHCAHLGTIPVIQGGELFITQIPGKEDLKMSDRLTMIIRRGTDKEKACSKAFLELISPSLKPCFLFRPACQRCIKQTAGSHSYAYGHCCPFLSESPMCPQCVCDIFCDFPKPLQAPCHVTTAPDTYSVVDSRGSFRDRLLVSLRIRKAGNVMCHFPVQYNDITQ